jgi:hypothetical protein
MRLPLLPPNLRLQVHRRQHIRHSVVAGHFAEPVTGCLLVHTESSDVQRFLAFSSADGFGVGVSEVRLSDADNGDLFIQGLVEMAAKAQAAVGVEVDVAVDDDGVDLVEVEVLQGSKDERKLPLVELAGLVGSGWAAGPGAELGGGGGRPVGENGSYQFGGGIGVVGVEGEEQGFRF